MKKNEFLEIYKKLTYEAKTQIEEKLEAIESLQEIKEDLSEKINALSPNDLDTLEKEQIVFIRDSNSELNKIERAKYNVSDREEAEEFRNMDIIEHEQHTHEILTSEYPIGIDILNEQIDKIENEILKLIPAL